MTRVQDVLGEHQDAIVAGNEITGLLERQTDAPAPAFQRAAHRLLDGQAEAARVSSRCVLRRLGQARPEAVAPMALDHRLTAESPEDTIPPNESQRPRASRTTCRIRRPNRPDRLATPGAGSSRRTRSAGWMSSPRPPPARSSTTAARSTSAAEVAWSGSRRIRPGIRRRLPRPGTMGLVVLNPTFAATAPPAPARRARATPARCTREIIRDRPGALPDLRHGAGADDGRGRRRGRPRAGRHDPAVLDLRGAHGPAAPPLDGRDDPRARAGPHGSGAGRWSGSSSPWRRRSSSGADGRSSSGRGPR